MNKFLALLLGQTPSADLVYRNRYQPILLIKRNPKSGKLCIFHDGNEKTLEDFHLTSTEMNSIESAIFAVLDPMPARPLRTDEIFCFLKETEIPIPSCILEGNLARRGASANSAEVVPMRKTYPPNKKVLSSMCLSLGYIGGLKRPRIKFCVPFSQEGHSVFISPPRALYSYRVLKNCAKAILTLAGSAPSEDSRRWRKIGDNTEKFWGLYGKKPN